MRTRSTAILIAALAAAPATTAPGDPAVLYLDAAAIVQANVDRDVMCPAASNLSYGEAPPYPPAWHRYEDADYPANAAARALARRARSLDHPHWPPAKDGMPNLPNLNRLRGLANELGDATLYEHLRGDDAAAVETVRDELHLADLLAGTGDGRYLVDLLVGVGIRAHAVNRLMVVASDLHLADGPAGVRPGTVRDLIRQLCDPPDPAAAVAASIKAEQATPAATTRPIPPDRLAVARDSALLTAKRANAEAGMAALSLACHLYRADHGTWPATLADLKPYCPTLPTDPFADGKRPLGYDLIPRGLPDGGDRPIVYDRESDDGSLALRADRPAYGYYSPPADHGKHPRRGQFRDVAAWRGAANGPPQVVPFDEP